MRTPLVSLVAAALVFAGAGCAREMYLRTPPPIVAVAHERQTPAPASPPAPEYSSLVGTYCVTCHNDRLKTAGLSLQTLELANVGFEVGDLQTGLILDRVAAEGYDKDALAKYECPSHGIALTPDERELWVADGVRNRLHVFDATVYPPVALTAVELPAQPRWIVFSNDGRYVYASTGDVVAAATRKIVGALEDPAGARVKSENLLEIDFAGGQPVR